MIQAISFGIAMFVGWLFLDWMNEKRIRKEKVVEALIAAAIGAGGWLILDVILSF
ncbi:hypothetical protein [Salsuginibacillus kocurii]|uniref:hypothetical protein n=1 Tax=Salsuginibacillus kocurii TaxID=427078 RepID=UPI00035CDF9B|nr:hypothetical protein [Salsuginibacillus kocurii]